MHFWVWISPKCNFDWIHNALFWAQPQNVFYGSDTAHFNVVLSTNKQLKKHSSSEHLLDTFSLAAWWLTVWSHN